MKRFAIILTICLSVLNITEWACAFFPGYVTTPWGTDATKVMKSFPKGIMGRLHNQLIYKQLQPTKDIRQRSFAFHDNKLHAITISFAPAYVNKIGIENLLAKHQKQFGTGKMDRSNAPHLISCVWEDDTTRITFAYAPRKPEYTVLMFQQKQNESLPQ
jgi:hypothetical protein